VNVNAIAFGSANPASLALPALRRVAGCPIPVQQAQLQSEQQGAEQQEQQLLRLAQRSLEASAE
jgi:hypothetical protein